MHEPPVPPVLSGTKQNSKEKVSVSIDRGPGPREREQLRETLEEGISLMDGLCRSEENLQRQLIQGDYRTLIATTAERDELQRRLAAFEARCRLLVPRGMKLTDYIQSSNPAATAGGTADLERLQALHGQLRDTLLQVGALQEINRALFRERVRFSREMQALLGGEAYNDRGEPSLAMRENTTGLDRNC